MAPIDLYLMSPPPEDWTLRGRANFRSAAAVTVDARKARAEWVSLADAIEARGGRVCCLLPLPGAGLTGLPFAAEAGQVVQRGGDLFFLLPRMKPLHRRPERTAWTQAAAQMGMKTAEVLPDVPGHEEDFWEGQGDVAWFRDTALLFHGGRTTRRGAESAAAWFPDHFLVEIREPAFHGNMAVLPLSSIDRLLVCPEVIARRSLEQLTARFGDSLDPVTEDEIRSYATNGLPIGRDLLAPHTIPPRVKTRMETWGLRVVLLAMEELCVKAGGASRCLVSAATVEERLLTIPPEMDYRRLRPQLISG